MDSLLPPTEVETLIEYAAMTCLQAHARWTASSCLRQLQTGQKTPLLMEFCYNRAMNRGLVCRQARGVSILKWRARSGSLCLRFHIANDIS